MKAFTKALSLPLILSGSVFAMSACGSPEIARPIGPVAAREAVTERTQNNPVEVQMEEMSMASSRRPWLQGITTEGGFEPTDSESHYTIPHMLLHSGYAKALVEAILAGYSHIERVVSSREESVISDLVAADEWYEAALAYSNYSNCKTRLQHLPWKLLSAYGGSLATGVALVYMGHNHDPLLCPGHQVEDCNTSLFLNGGLILGVASLARLVYSACTVPEGYGFGRSMGLAERVEDIGLQKYYYIMSAICAEQSAYSAACLPNDNPKRLDLTDNVSCWRWAEACARWRHVGELEADRHQKLTYAERVDLMQGMVHWCRCGHTDQLCQAADRFIQLATSDHASNPERVLDAYRAMLIAYGVQDYYRGLYDNDVHRYADRYDWCQSCVQQVSDVLASCECRTAIPLRHRLKIKQPGLLQRFTNRG